MAFSIPGVEMVISRDILFGCSLILLISMSLRVAVAADDTTLALLKKCVQGGYALCERDLGKAYLYGEHGATKNIKQAKHWLELAVKHGDAYAVELLSEAEQQPHQQEWTTFSTKDHPKAKGLDMRINYPSSWTRKESGKENTVQVFSDDKQVIVSIQIRGAEVLDGRTLTKDKADAMTMLMSVESSLPKNSIVYSNQLTEIGDTAVRIVDYSTQVSYDKQGAVERYLWMFFSYAGRYISVENTVIAMNEREAAVHMERMRPIFFDMMSSIVLPAQP